MGKHPDAEKAKKGYKNCPKCNMTHSPEAIVKGTGTYAMYDKNTGKIETGIKKESLESEAVSGELDDQQAINLKIDELGTFIHNVIERIHADESIGKSILTRKLRTLMFRIQDMKNIME
jgi:protein-arginine kinase activator protein McsA